MLTGGPACQRKKDRECGWAGMAAGPPVGLGDLGRVGWPG
jgi:hypothetical protein